MAYTTINRPTDYFRVKTYTGNSTDNTSITWDETDTNFGTNLLLWLKQRTVAAQEHYWVDSVRGAGVFLESDTTNAELSGTTAFDSFDTNGFTVDDAARTNRGTMVGWGWNTSGSASSNTDGSITSSVSANTTAGFSIVSYTGTGSQATVGHGLGTAPSVLIHKKRTTSAEAWSVFHQSVGITKRMILNSTEAATADASPQPDWNDVLPTSSVFTIGTSSRTNATEDYICYAFAEKKGYSKFGSYTGNGNADGAFIYLGFKPAYMLVKRTDGTDNWTLWDNKRETTMNPNDNVLYPSLSNVESTSDTSYACDFLSNGIKWRGTSTGMNTSGGNYIYMAFAENPIVGSNNIPATAR